MRNTQGSRFDKTNNVYASIRAFLSETGFFPPVSEGMAMKNNSDCYTLWGRRLDLCKGTSSFTTIAFVLLVQMLAQWKRGQQHFGIT